MIKRIPEIQKKINTLLKKEDMVVAIAGKNKGKKGKILFVDRIRGRVIVEGLNFVRRHTRPNANNQQGGIVEKEASLAISNILLYCSDCERGVRIGRKVLENKNKIRTCRVCGNEI